MLEIPFFVFAIVALLGGALSFMSPCTAVILPTFFAYTFKEKTKLVWATIVFFLGLVLIYVPLGLGLGIFGRLLPSSKSGFGIILGIIFITFGLLSLSGKGFELGLSKLHPKFNKDNPATKFFSIFTLGFFTGLGTTPCAGPILGAIATLAAASGNSVSSVVLMGIYTLGLFIPLMIISLFFEKVAIFRRMLNGKLFIFSIAKKKVSIHSTNLFAGILFIGMGIFFLIAGNTASLTSAFLNIGILEKTFDLQDSLLESLMPIN